MVSKAQFKFGIYGSEPLSLKFAFHLIRLGHPVQLIGQDMDGVQAGFRMMAQWVDELALAGVQGVNSEILHRVTVGCGLERLAHSDLVVLGASERSDEFEENELLGDILAIVGPETPILVHRERPEAVKSEGTALLDSPRFIEFTSFHRGYLQSPLEAYRSSGNEDSLARAEGILAHCGIRLAVFVPAQTTLLRRTFLHQLDGILKLLLVDGESAADLDLSSPRTPLGVGPLLSADILGLETIMEMNSSGGYPLRLEIVELLNERMEQDQFGLETGRGFYVHEGN